MLTRRFELLNLAIVGFLSQEKLKSTALTTRPYQLLITMVGADIYYQWLTPDTIFRVLMSIFQTCVGLGCIRLCWIYNLVFNYYYFSSSHHLFAIFSLDSTCAPPEDHPPPITYNAERRMDPTHTQRANYRHWEYKSLDRLHTYGGSHFVGPTWRRPPHCLNCTGATIGLSDDDIKSWGGRGGSVPAWHWEGPGSSRQRVRLQS